MMSETVRKWDFCDQCIFFVACLKTERKAGDGCSEFYPYPHPKERKDRKEISF